MCRCQTTDQTFSVFISDFSVSLLSTHFRKHHKMQFWEFVDGSSNDHDTTHSSRYQGDIVSDTGGVTEPNSWFQPPNFSNTNAMETESFQEIFGGLTDIECHPILQATTSTELETELPWESCKVESSGSKKKFEDIPPVRKSQNEGTDKLCGEPRRKKHDQRPKRTRSVEMHNVSERRRRDRINGKLRALQELIPNCHKQDRASMLEDAVEYLKALKLQVEMLSMSSGAMFQASRMSQAGIPSVPMPQFSIDAPMRPSSGMGMFSMFHSLGLPMISLPSAVYLHSSPSAAAAAGLNPMTAHGNHPISQVQIPFISSQTLPAEVATPRTAPTFATGSLLHTIVLSKDSLV